MNLPHSLSVSLALTLTLAMGCSSNTGATASTASTGTTSGGTGGGGGGDGGPPVDPLTLDPTQPGAYICGHRELSMTYAPPGGLPMRTIPVHVWYPSRSMNGDHPKYEGLFEDDHSFNDVPLAMPTWASGKLPVLVHSHGWKGFAGNSARLMCHFASHGWLAVAPEHVGNLLGDTPVTETLAIYIQRPFDIRASLDFVTALPTGDALAGKADMGHVAMSGHSFGTYTAWAISGATVNVDNFKMRCAKGDTVECTDAEYAVLGGDLSDKRAQVVIPMAGAPNGEVTAAGYDAAKVPVLMMSGTLNEVGDDTVYAGATKLDLTWVTVDGGCHQLFGLGNSVLGAAGCKVLPDEEGFSLVNPWVLSYARYHVLADRSAKVKGLVEGTDSISTKVHVQHKAKP